LGVIWACWHLPLFYVPSAQNFGQSFPTFVLEVIAISVAMTWLYVNTNGSLMLATLMHWAIVQMTRIVPPHL
jgi:membrane protease YdiL (CAAX protease family)